MVLKWVVVVGGLRHNVGSLQGHVTLRHRSTLKDGASCYGRSNYVHRRQRWVAHAALLYWIVSP